MVKLHDDKIAWWSLETDVLTLQEIKWIERPLRQEMLHALLPVLLPLTPINPEAYATRNDSYLIYQLKTHFKGNFQNKFLFFDSLSANCYARNMS